MEKTAKTRKIRRVFVDMDGVIADFDKGAGEAGLDPKEFKLKLGAYRHLSPMPGAIRALKKLAEMGWEVWIATKPPKENPWASSEKVEWIHEHLPELKERIVITFSKGFLGGPRDVLIDDRLHKASCADFRGMLVHFGAPGAGKNWASIVSLLSKSIQEEPAPKKTIKRAGPRGLAQDEKTGKGNSQPLVNVGGLLMEAVCLCEMARLLTLLA